MQNTVEAYSTGDNWHEPYVSGYDNLWLRIVEDMEKRPYAYDDEEKALFELDTLHLSLEQEKMVRDYIENWIYSH